MRNNLYNKVKRYKKKRIGIITTKNILLVVIFLVSFISIGYSYYNTTLRINGTVTAIGDFFPTYHITYDTDGGQFYDTPVSEYNVNTETFNLPNPVKAGNKFVGWTDGSTESEEVLQNSIRLVVDQVYTAGTQNNKTIYIKATSGDVYASFVTYQNKPRCMVFVYDTSTSVAQYSTTGNSWTTINNWISTTTVDNETIYYQFFTLSEGGQNQASGIPTYNGSFDDFTAAIIETEKIVTHNPWTVVQGSEGDLDLTAVWEASTTYTITFNGNDGQGTMPDQIIQSGDTENLLENKFSKTNYTFAGWATTSNGSVVYEDGEQITPNRNLNLYAKWEKTVHVTFYANGGSGTMSYQVLVEGEPQNLKLNEFTKTNEYFIGWATTSNGQVVYTNGQSITINDDIDLYAVWDNTCTVSFNSNGGTGTMTSQTFQGGETKAIKTNTFTRNGYVFRGWATSSDATTADYQDEETISPIANITLYALWKKTYTVTFNANNGTGTMQTQTFVEGEPQALNTHTFTRNNYVFRGWATTANATSATYTENQEITINANTTLYVYWKRTYTVTFNANNGTGTMQAQTFVAGEPQTLTLNSFTRNRYRFNGWGTSRNGNTVTYTDGQEITINANTTLYAKWVRN